MTETKRPLKVFPSASLRASLCHAHIIPLQDADRDPVKAFDGRVGGVLSPYRDHSRLTQDGVDAWLDKEKLLPGQDWELEIRKAV